MMISTLQSRLESLLQANAYFSGVEILTEERGDLVTAIQKAVNQTKFFVWIVTPEGMPTSSKGDAIRIKHRGVIQVIESHLLNKTGKRSRDAVDYVIAAVHNEWCGLGNADHPHESTKWNFLGYRAVTELPPEMQSLTVYAVEFEVTASFQPPAPPAP